jgi:predicted Fe-Mo cluster-binding NifX family protein
MRIVVTAAGAGLNAPASPVFGRCPMYIFVDTETMQFEAVENPAVGAPGGAGIQAAQLVVERGAQAVITGNVGPNAFRVLQSAGVPVHLFGEGTVGQAVEAYREGKLAAAGAATAPEHAGRGRGRGRGGGAGRGVTVPRASAGSRQEEIASLQEMAGDLRRQLAGLIERLDRLERAE